MLLLIVERAVIIPEFLVQDGNEPPIRPRAASVGILNSKKVLVLLFCLSSFTEPSIFPGSLRGFAADPLARGRLFLSNMRLGIKTTWRNKLHIFET